MTKQAMPEKQGKLKTNPTSLEREREREREERGSKEEIQDWLLLMLHMNY